MSIHKVNFNDNTCTRCNLCAEVCPNKIIFLNKSTNKMESNEERLPTCITCIQCMAVCPTKSININDFNYTNDLFELPKAIVYEDVFYNMISTRRAIRNFKDKEVPKEILEKIVNAITFAPPGFTPIKTEITVVQNREIIKKALPLMIDFYESLLNTLQNPIAKFIIKKRVGNQKYKTIHEHLIPLLQRRLPALKEGKEDTLTRNAPAMIIFHADKNGEDIKNDIIIAATYGMLAAHSLGLGGSIMDIITPAIERDEELRKLFRIPENNEVISCIIIGYPKYKYSHGIKRNLKSVQWI